MKTVMSSLVRLCFTSISVPRGSDGEKILLDIYLSTFVNCEKGAQIFILKCHKPKRMGATA